MRSGGFAPPGCGDLDRRGSPRRAMPVWAHGVGDKLKDMVPGGKGKEMGESEGWKVLGVFIGKGEDLPEKERFCR